MSRAPAPRSTASANYGWPIPTVGGDADAWGGELNTMIAGVDSVVFAKPNMTVGATAPSSPNTGDLFFNTSNSALYTWNGSAWVQVNIGAYLALTGGTLTGPLAGTSASFSSLSGPGGNAAPIAIADPPAADVSKKLATTEWIAANRTMGDNRIINGDMRVNQWAGNATNNYIIDRWYCQGTTTGKFQTLGQYTNGAGGLAIGFGYALQATSPSSAYAVPATETYFYRQALEADTIADFAWGTASAQPVTLSFWVSCSTPGTYGGSVRNYSGTRSYPFTYTLAAANTWQKFTITIPGDTAGTWVLQGAAGALYVDFDLGSGANYSAPAGAWATGNYVSANGVTNLLAVATNNWFLTGVKLELGSVATPFNHPPLAQALAACQRYFSYIGAQSLIWGGNITNGISYYYYVNWPVTMRATPTVTLETLSQSGFASLAMQAASVYGMEVVGVAGATQNGGYFCPGYSASAEL